MSFYPTSNVTEFHKQLSPDGFGTAEAYGEAAEKQGLLIMATQRMRRDDFPEYARRMALAQQKGLPFFTPRERGEAAVNTTGKPMEPRFHDGSAFGTVTSSVKSARDHFEEMVGTRNANGVVRSSAEEDRAAEEKALKADERTHNDNAAAINERRAKLGMPPLGAA